MYVETKSATMRQTFMDTSSSLPCLNTNFKQLLQMFTIDKDDQNCEQILKNLMDLSLAIDRKCYYY